MRREAALETLVEVIGGRAKERHGRSKEPTSQQGSCGVVGSADGERKWWKEWRTSRQRNAVSLMLR
jgi:hypothetical protein